MLINLTYLFYKRLNFNINLLSMQLLQNLPLFLVSNLRYYLNFILIKDSQLHIFVRKDFIYEVCFFLKNSVFTFCNQLLDITVVDRIEFLRSGYRWEYVYMLLSTFYNLRIFIRGYLKFYQSLVSIVDLFSSANWLEREV
jgi:NADH:ubiquinone oxidoreductase subunit C